ncbi:MAG TPA: alpha/beta hydrolase [Gemmatimonadaceae bacterium]|nr:alpha/beta hydrolase [Gemmatimonadaceae bacterium]
MAPAPIPAPRVSGFTRSTASPLYWCSYGPEGAPRLLVLHGGPGADHAYLLPQLLELAAEFELIFYDQRGGGRSREATPSRVTWQVQVEDLAHVVREFAVEPLTLVGYSWGGLLALLYAREAAAGRLSPRPSRLALIDPAPVSRRYRDVFEAEFARRQNGPAIQAMRTKLAASGLKERDPGAYRQRAFELSVAGYFADPARATDLTPFRVTGRVQQSVWESLGDFDLTGDLGAVHCPAIVVHGRQDPIPLASSESIATSLGAEFVPLDDCGHVPYVEQPVKLFSALKRFLQSR